MDNYQIVKTKDVIGKNTYNYENEKLGTIEEIVLDKVNGQTKYVVLSFGGFLGFGDKLFALPWNCLKYDAEKDSFKINVDKQRLESAPNFDKNNWPNFSDRSVTESISSYYI